MRNYMHNIRTLLAICLGVLWNFCALAQPYGVYEPSAANDYINIYQKYLSGLKNTRCSMYPTCSNYAKMVFADNSFPVAMVLTADRLIRCSHDLDYYATTIVYGFPSAIDYPKSRKIPEDVVLSSGNNVFASYSHLKDSLSQAVDFTSFLINQKNFSNAMLEIDKLLFYYPGTVVTMPNLYVNKLKCYEGLKQFSDGIMSYEQLFPSIVKDNFNVVYTLAHLYDVMGDVDGALARYEDAESLYDEGDLHPYGEMAILYAKKSRIGEAEDALKKKYDIDRNASAFDSSITVLEDLRAFKIKNPHIARSLSIVPGCGYFYTKQPKNALAALIINGVLGYAAYSSFNTKNYGVGAILGAMSLSFYLGNIYGSGTSAERYNDKAVNDAVNKLRYYNPYIN